MQYVIAIISGYLLGSVSFSYLFGRLFKQIDIRKHGSGNAGATNTLRVLGLAPALAVLALDIGKGVLAVWIGFWLGDDLWLPVLGGLSVIAGHNWPVFFGFRGGKGIATAIGVFATLCFWPALYAGIIAIASVIVFRYVSLGSLLFTALTPVFLWIHQFPHEILIASAVIFCFSVYRHRENIRKLLQGRENKLTFRSKPKGDPK